MVFYSHARLHADHIPDDIILPDLVFDPRYGRRPASESNKAFLVDAPSGKEFDIETSQERTESLAKGLLQELGIQIGWKGVIGLFAPNSVASSISTLKADRFSHCFLGCA